MKRIIATLLVACMVISLSACGNAKNKESKNNEINKNEPTVASKEDEIQDEGWDKLEKLGEVKTENGILTVSITMPADLVGEDMTQEKLDSEVEKNYISAKLNEDGSVTYKMTKKQHKAMLDEVTKSVEDSFNELINDTENTFTNIKHNKDFTQFDVTISTDEVGLIESFSVLAFYMYGGIYGILNGEKPDNIVVNYYNAAGNLIQTANSADMGN